MLPIFIQIDDRIINLAQVASIDLIEHDGIRIHFTAGKLLSLKKPDAGAFLSALHQMGRSKALITVRVR